MKLYRVTVKGFPGGRYRVSYAVGKSPDDAYQKVRAFLDDKGIGSYWDRALNTVELLAEVGEYPECAMQLFL